MQFSRPAPCRTLVSPRGERSWNCAEMLSPIETDLFQSELHMGFALPGKEKDGHPECE